MKYNTTNWLITFSDLFFILVSFFILRHQLLIEPDNSFSIKPLKKVNKELNTTAYKKYEESIFKLSTQSEQKISLSIPITSAWFSAHELSLIGKQEIRTLSHMLENKDLTLEIAFYNSNDQFSDNLQNKAEQVINELKLLGIKSLKLSLITKSNQSLATNKCGDAFIIFDSTPIPEKELALKF